MQDVSKRRMTAGHEPLLEDRSFQKGPVVIARHDEWPSFGALLKTFRRRRHLTQEQLAAGIGVHRHAIGRWEQGDGLPSTKTIVLELARHLRLDDQEARQLLEASFAALAPPCSIPYPRNPWFTGREELLETLHLCLFPNRPRPVSPSYALHGLGGIGKTHLALEYAYRHSLEYTAVFWISAASAETILACMLTIAEVLRLPERAEADQQRILLAVQHWLSTHNQWLLIWDNLDDVTVLQRYLPSVHHGAILITTRRRALGTLAQGIELYPMKEEEGILFLLCRAKLLEPGASMQCLSHLAQSLSTEYAAARELVATMGGLPLALDQVGAFVEETPCSLADYLQLYEGKRAVLLHRRGELAVDSPASVGTTWSLAFERVEQANKAAAQLLRWCAFLHPEAIPEDLFAAKKTAQEEWDGLVTSDTFALYEAIRVASAFSLLKRDVEKQTLSLHRLVQVVLQEGMSQQERAEVQQRVIRRLNALFPMEAIHETWPQCERLLPHVLTCANTMPEHAEDQDLAAVLRKAADYLCKRARYKQAEPLYQRAIFIWKQLLRPVHPEMARSLSGLAYLFYEQGKYEQVEALLQQALCTWEQASGPEPPELARILNKLANLYGMQGKYEQARTVYEQALRIWEQALGPEHPMMAPTLNNLALLFAEQGQYAQAEPLYQRALAIEEQTYGPDHPQVAYPLDNLARLFAAQGRFHQAEPLYQRALCIWEQTLGAEHPLVAYPLFGLADLLREQGQFEDAEALYRRSLHIREQALGPDHPDVALSLNGLALLSSEQRRDKEAGR